MGEFKARLFKHFFTHITARNDFFLQNVAQPVVCFLSWTLVMFTTNQVSSRTTDLPAINMFPLSFLPFGSHFAPLPPSLKTVLEAAESGTDTLVCTLFQLDFVFRAPKMAPSTCELHDSELRSEDENHLGELVLFAHFTVQKVSKQTAICISIPTRYQPPALLASFISRTLLLGIIA